MISGNFASVFPMTSASGHKYAVKCFTRQASHQLERYELISSQLGALKPWWATDFEFIPDGIEVNGARYPILRMNWVKGSTLTAWISDKVQIHGAVADLSHRFDRVVRDLAVSRIAHGDLQAGNLLITDNAGLHLVDYDGMFVPGLEKLPPNEIGHPDYQPPGRSQHDYGPSMDRFSAWLISLSLKILAVAPELWEQLNPGHDEYLLLNRSDLRGLTASRRFAVLSAHPNAEVRRLAQMMRQMLSLPMASIPALVVTAPNTRRTPSPSPPADPRGLPGWMRSHITEPAGSPVSTDAQSPISRNDRNDRRLTWLARILIALPLTAFAGISDPPASVPVFITAIFLVTIALFILYLHSPYYRTFAELKRGHWRATSSVKRSARRISRTEKEMTGSERSKNRLADRHTKQQTALQSVFDRKKRKESHEIQSIDRQLAQLGDRKLQEIGRRLMQYQQSFIAGQLTQAVLRANDVPGVGAQLVARLHAAGVRTAADFTGISYSSNGGSAIVRFHLTAGWRAHIPGIGKVKAQRIDQWRRAHIRNAVAMQPSVLPPSELGPIEVRFAVEERQLQQQRTHATQQIADQIAQIDRDLNTALTELRKQQQTELSSLEQRRSAQAAQLGDAYSSRLAAEQTVSDWNNLIASATRPTFSRFVSAVVRGRDPGSVS